MSRPFNTPDVFRAIADPTRRKILQLLRQSERSPGDFIRPLDILSCLCNNMCMSRPFNTPDVFRAIADPTRRRILQLLRQADRSPGELMQSFKLSQPSISQHLRTLRLAGLIEQRRRGKGLVCQVTLNSLQQVSAWLAQLQPRRS